MFKFIRSKKKYKKIYLVIISCIVSGLATFLFLSACGFSARLRAQNRFVEPDYVRYYSQGYSFEPISNKISVLLNIADEGELIRSMLITLDSDLNTLDLFDMPTDMKFFADGFSGSLKDAYKTGVYKNLLSRALSLEIDHHITLSSDGVAYILDSLSEGKRLLSFENSKMIISLPDAYGSQENIKAYHTLLVGALSQIEKLGAKEVFSKSVNTLLNAKEGSMTLSDHVEIFNVLNAIPKNKMTVSLYQTIERN